MPGIAGIVLTIGVGVDSNVLIFERIREELKTARGPARAMDLGFERAMSSIIDANITTLIVAIILYFVGSGSVQGLRGDARLRHRRDDLHCRERDAADHDLLVRLAPAEDGHGLGSDDMAFRFRMVPDVTHIDFFKTMRFWLALSIIGMVVSIGSIASRASTTASTSAAAPS